MRDKNPVLIDSRPVVQVATTEIVYYQSQLIHRRVEYAIYGPLGYTYVTDI